MLGWAPKPRYTGVNGIAERPLARPGDSANLVANQGNQMNIQQGKAAPTPFVRFIQDDPAPEDFFGAHRRTARAIAVAISQNPSLKTIGILGPWGSGKSTVIRQLQEILAAGPVVSHASARDIHVFTFDAWLRHGEPVRRSFLEELLQFASVRNLGPADEIRETIDRVSGRLIISDTTETPRLSSGGAAILISVALGAIVAREHVEILGIPGMNQVTSFVRETLSLGWLAALLPLLLPVVTIFAVIGVRWARRWAPKEQKTGSIFGDPTTTPQEPILSLLMSTQHQSKRTRVTGNVNPSALEFREVYWGLLQAIHASGARLAIVVDNLDRIPADDARELWALLRTFFTSDAPGMGPQVSPPVVIVPVALAAVDSMHAASGAADTGEGFLHKTFDAIFHLPTPMFNAWQRYLAKQLQFVLGEVATDARVQGITLIADNVFTQGETTITPRRINSLVNLIGTYWLSHGDDDIPLETMAYYCLRKGAFDRDVLAEVRMKKTALDVIDPAWPTHLTALHFGIRRADALPVLLDEPLRNAIDGRNAEEFQAIMKIEGAHMLLLREVRSASKTGQSAMITTLSLIGLSSGLIDLRPQDADHLHRHLIQLLEMSTGWTSVAAYDIGAFKALVAATGERLRPVALAAIEKSFSQASGDSAVLVTHFGEFWRWAAAEFPPAVAELTDIRVPGGHHAFLALAATFGALPLLLKRIQPLLGFSEVMSQIGGSLLPGGSADPAEVASQIRTLMSLHQPLDWSRASGQALTVLATTAHSAGERTFKGLEELEPALVVVAGALDSDPSVRDWLAKDAQSIGLPRLLSAVLHVRTLHMARVAGQLSGLMLAIGLRPKLVATHAGTVLDAASEREFVSALDETLRLALTDKQASAPLTDLILWNDDSAPVDFLFFLDLVRQRREAAASAFA